MVGILSISESGVNQPWNSCGARMAIPVELSQLACVPMRDGVEACSSDGFIRVAGAVAPDIYRLDPNAPVCLVEELILAGLAKRDAPRR